MTKIKTSSLSRLNMRVRVTQGSVYTVFGFGGANLLRLASNLILTRMLFPEAFGLMAIVEVFMMGLKSASDLGMGMAIVQSKHGDDPAFLNSAWMMSIARGGLLWLFMCVLAAPAAAIYSHEILKDLLPIVGLNALIQGFVTTNIASQNKHLLLRRLTVLELLAQILGILCTVIIVFYERSVWGLVYAGLLSSLLRVCILNNFLPGIKNRFVWHPSSLIELFDFGKFIFVSTLAGFFLNYGDRAILARYVDLAHLANYNIAYFLASVPWLLNLMIVNKVLFPLYSRADLTENKKTEIKISQLRYSLTLVTISFSLFLVVFGEYLIENLYDERYHQAGLILAATSLALLPQAIVSVYGSTILARGNSKHFAILLISSATIRTCMLLVLVPIYGLVGVLITFSLGTILNYPLVAYFAQRHHSLDLKHDMFYFVLVFVIFAFCAPYFDHWFDVLG